LHIKGVSASQPMMPGSVAGVWQVALKQKSTHFSICSQVPFSEQVSTMCAPSAEQRLEPGVHSTQVPETQTGVVAGHVRGSQAPFAQTRAVVAEVHSCAPSVH
jgi:hypothetical protein